MLDADIPIEIDHRIDVPNQAKERLDIADRLEGAVGLVGDVGKLGRAVTARALAPHPAELYVEYFRDHGNQGCRTDTASDNDVVLVRCGRRVGRPILEHSGDAEEFVMTKGCVDRTLEGEVGGDVV